MLRLFVVPKRARLPSRVPFVRVPVRFFKVNWGGLFGRSGKSESQQPTKKRTWTPWVGYDGAPTFKPEPARIRMYWDPEKWRSFAFNRAGVVSDEQIFEYEEEEEGEELSDEETAVIETKERHKFEKESEDHTAKTVLDKAAKTADRAKQNLAIAKFSHTMHERIAELHESYESTQHPVAMKMRNFMDATFTETEAAKGWRDIQEVEEYFSKQRFSAMAHRFLLPLLLHSLVRMDCDILIELVDTNSPAAVRILDKLYIFHRDMEKRARQPEVAERLEEVKKSYDGLFDDMLVRSFTAPKWRGIKHMEIERAGLVNDIPIIVVRATAVIANEKNETQTNLYFVTFRRDYLAKYGWRVIDVTEHTLGLLSV